jgi:hypothetical protein
LHDVECARAALVEPPREMHQAVVRRTTIMILDG